MVSAVPLLAGGELGGGGGGALCRMPKAGGMAAPYLFGIQTQKTAFFLYMPKRHKGPLATSMPSTRYWLYHAVTNQPLSNNPTMQHLDFFLTKLQ